MGIVSKDINSIKVNLPGARFSISISKLWDNGPGAYGFHTLLKLYAGIKHWHRGIVVQHGWAPADRPDMNDINNAKHLQLCMSKRDRDNFRKYSTVRCEIAGSPFVHYRRSRDITVDRSAKGTVAFPAHSVPGLFAEFDLDGYCKTLLNLPEKYHPITICLHPADIVAFQLDQKYQRYGFKTVSAGVGTSKPFYEAFYDILRRHKYSTSNEPGSYLFYAVEMGIPFFILGEPAIRDNSATKNIDVPDGRFNIIDMKYGKMAFDLFTGTDYDRITPEQMEYVISELGMEDCLSPQELRAAFDDVGVKLYYKENPVSQALLAGKMMLKYPLAMGEFPGFFSRIWHHGRRSARAAAAASEERS